MKDILIIGAGGFGREVQWLIERINAQRKEVNWKILGYIDDGVEKGTEINGYKVLGDVSFLQDMEQPVNVVCAIGNSVVRQNIINKLINKKNMTFPNLIDPQAMISERVEIGKGNIICANSIMTTNILIGDFCIFNLSCTVGHDVDVGNYVTVYPSVNISGCVEVGGLSEIGTGTQIIQGIHLCDRIIIGAGTVVIKDIADSGTYVGSPARRVK